MVVCSCMFSCVWLFATPWTAAHQAPLSMGFPRGACPWDFPGKNTRVGCDFLLQGIFPTQRWNPLYLHLLLRQADSWPLRHLESLFWWTCTDLESSPKLCISIAFYPTEIHICIFVWLHIMPQNSKNEDDSIALWFARGDRNNVNKMKWS